MPPPSISSSSPCAPCTTMARLDKYDYDNNMFGFVKGDLSLRQVRDSHLPSAPARHTFGELVQRRCHPAEEPDLLEGRAQDRHLVIWREMTDEDKIPGVVSGTIDVTDPSYFQGSCRADQGSQPERRDLRRYHPDRPRRQPRLRLCRLQRQPRGRSATATAVMRPPRSA